ncbi:MAG: hypothetical protein V4613_08985 [Bacteroidota bacterium]
MSCNQIQTNTSTDLSSVTPTIKTFVPLVKAALVQLFTINAKTGGKMTSKEGTTITVPENCFVTKEGQPVTGSVALSFSQYDSPMEIIASGIPMTIMANGVETAFESAGMFQINGKSGNEEVMVAKGKEITVDLNTCYKDTNYSFYQFDEKKGAWQTLMAPSELASVTNTPMQQTPPTEVQMVKPMKIEEFSSSTPVFELDVETKDIEELNTFHNILWTYAGEGTDPFKDKSFFKTKWQTTDIHPSLKIENAYEIKCTSGDKTVNTTVKPVLFGSQLKKAKAEYNRLMTEYNRQLEAAAKTAKRNEAYQNATRMLTLSSFGIFNCDRTWPSEATAYSNKEFTPVIEGNTDKNTVSCFYLINPDINSATILYGTGGLRYRKDCDNYVLAVMSDNGVAICKPDQLKTHIDNTETTKMNFTVSANKMGPNTQFADLLTN